MLEPNGNGAPGSDPLANTLFGNPGAPVTPAATTAVPQVQPQQPAVTHSEGDAPLPGHRSFNSGTGNRAHVQEAIVIPLQQPQQPQAQPQQVQPQVQQPQSQPVQPQVQLPQQLQLPGFPPQQFAQPGQPIMPGVLPGAPAIPGTQQIVDPAQNPQQPQTGHQVPVGVMLEERRRAQLAHDALAETRATNQQLMATLQALVQGQQPQQQQEQMIDPEVDLPGHLAQQQRQVQRMIQQGFEQIRAERQQQEAARINDDLNRSQAAAEGQFGPEMVAAAYQAVKANNMGQHFINKGVNAYPEMVRWYQGQMMLQQMGSNPTAYVQNLTQQIRAQVLAELRGNTNPPSNIPPSLATATSAHSSHVVVPPTNDFFQHMFTRPAGQQQNPRAA